MHVVLSLDKIIGRKHVGGWKHAPVAALRSKPGKHSAVVLTAEAAPAASAAAAGAESMGLDWSETGASASAAAAAASATRRSKPSAQDLGMTMDSGRGLRGSGLCQHKHNKHKYLRELHSG